jgi:hypothetical protein
MMERISSVLGYYGDTFPVSLLTNKATVAGGTNSTVKEFMNKRMLYCSEPERGMK